MAKKEDMQETLIMMPPSYDDAYRRGPSSRLPDDVFQYTEHVEVDFNSMFQDPKEYIGTDVGMANAPFIKGAYGKIYETVRTQSYYVLSVFLGYILAAVWGLVMGINSFVVVWIIQPAIKLVFMYFRIAFMVVRAVTQAVVVPVFESISSVFGGIRARFSVNVTGEPEYRKAITYG